MQRLWSQRTLLKYPLLFLAVSSLLLLVGGKPVAAASVPASAITAAREIDWAHPVHVQPVSVHSRRDTALPINTVPLSVPPKTGLAIQPQANFPGNCLDSYAYYVIVNGKTSWTAQAGGQKVQVWYMWCPRWQGDSIGINWSFGKIFQLSGCADISVGGPLQRFAQRLN
jgi:hypothetical protein